VFDSVFGLENSFSFQSAKVQVLSLSLSSRIINFSGGGGGGGVFCHFSG
jgi:hypothetical protein